jgi:hypothetical protein
MPNTPGVILILRHAEKPGNPSTDLESDGIHLSTQGQVRAAALSVSIPATFPKLDYLFASKQSRHSNRSVETVTPLAKAIGLEIDSQYGDDDYKKLARALLSDTRYTSKTILICWHHTRIPQMALSLGVDHAPAWPAGVFDRIWMIDYKEGTALIHNNPQMLLYGDSGV